MSALTADRNTPMLGAGGITITNPYKVAASTVIYEGGLVSINAAGYLVMAADTASTKCVGVARDHVDNSAGSNGDLTANVLSGVFHFVNGSSLTIANVGAKGYVSDSQTIAGTSTNSIEVGVIQNVDSTGVWIYAGLPAW